jgi:hypothetical protein
MHGLLHRRLLGNLLHLDQREVYIVKLYGNGRAREIFTQRQEDIVA